MPLFDKQSYELENHFEKWIYFFKNLNTFDDIPAILNEPIFKKGFEIAELSCLKPEQYDFYQKSLFDYWDVKHIENTAFQEGIEEGIIQGIEKNTKEMAIKMLKNELDIKDIIKMTGLSKVVILALSDIK